MAETLAAPVSLVKWRVVRAEKLNYFHLDAAQMHVEKCVYI